jgi:hypothetical protein
MRWTFFTFLILFDLLTLVASVLMWRFRLTWLTLRVLLGSIRGMRRCQTRITALIFLTLTSVFVFIRCGHIFSCACLFALLKMLLLLSFLFRLNFIPHFTLSLLWRTLLWINFCLLNAFVVLNVDLFRKNCVLMQTCLLWTNYEAGRLDYLFRVISTRLVNLCIDLISITTVRWRTLGSLFLACARWLNPINNLIFNWTRIKIAISNQNLITTGLIMKLNLFTAESQTKLIIVNWISWCCFNLVTTRCTIEIVCI